MTAKHQLSPHKCIAGNDNSDEIQSIRRRIETWINFLQEHDASKEFSPPFTLNKMENIVRIFFVKVQYNGPRTAGEMALMIKTRAGPTYVEINTNTILIDAIMKEREFVPLLKKL